MRGHGKSYFDLLDEIDRLMEEKSAIESAHAAEVAGLVELITSLQDEARQLRASLAVATTSLPNVWLWQGDGKDDLESLACPVVMSSDTLRGIESSYAAEVAKLREENESLRKQMATMVRIECLGLDSYESEEGSLAQASADFPACQPKKDINQKG